NNKYKRLNIMNKNNNEKCWRGCQEIGTYMHMWWDCKHLTSYWKVVQTECNKILKSKFELKPEIFLLGLSDPKENLDANKDKLFTYFITAARIIIAKHWKSETPPTKELWIDKIIEIRDMDRLTFLLKNNMDNKTKETDLTDLEDYLKDNYFQLKKYLKNKKQVLKVSTLYNMLKEKLWKIFQVLLRSRFYNNNFKKRRRRKCCSHYLSLTSWLRNNGV
uniref:Uncharacterized protein n=1 Tax=Anolis carolinensis TaxID=28377 RepID=A0A803T586_ANOCA